MVSFGSASLCIMYAPITRTFFIHGLVAMMPAAAESAVGKEAHAHPTSKVPAFLAPSFCCTTTEVAGVT
jgi:hypothetical protein